jgi:hypothetical protein
MTLKRKNTHRTIYKKHYGPIPTDTDGRTYDIHHIDGDHSNNDPYNLIAVTLQEHYDIHYLQDDWPACHTIALRMKISTEIISELARKSSLKRVKEGTHHFLGGEIQRRKIREGSHQFLNSEYQRKNALKKVEEGTHPFLDKKAASARARKRVEDGTHHFIGLNDRRIKEGTHNFSRENNPRFDHKLYSFHHKETNEGVLMTGLDFSKKFNLSNSSIRRMINGFNKSVHGWFIIK